MHAMTALVREVRHGVATFPCCPWARILETNLFRTMADLPWLTETGAG